MLTPAHETKIGGSENLNVMVEAINYNEFLLDQVAEAMTNRRQIVDFGAGQGTIAKPLKHLGFDIVCIEPEPNLNNLLKAEGFETYAMLEALPEESVEGVYSLNVLEHIENDEAALSNIYDKLMPGGNIYIYVPAFQILYSSMDKRVGHVRRYRLLELVKKCHRAGFTIERAEYCDSLGFFLTLVYKIIGSSKGEINRSMLKMYDKYLFPISRVMDHLFRTVLGKNVYIIARKR